MACNPNNISIGYADVSIAPWKSGGTGQVWTDLGLCKDIELTPKYENSEIEYENFKGVALIEYIKDEYTFKGIFGEATLANLKTFLQQPDTNLTGTAPNSTLIIGDRVPSEFAIQITTKGEKGATGVKAAQVYTLYRAVIENLEAIKFSAKTEKQIVPTLKILKDSTVTPASFGKVVNSGAA